MDVEDEEKAPSRPGRPAIMSDVGRLAGVSLDRLTMDMGVVKGLDAAGRVSARAGIEAGTFNDRLLYQFPYIGGVAVLSHSAPWYAFPMALLAALVFVPMIGVLEIYRKGDMGDTAQRQRGSARTVDERRHVVRAHDLLVVHGDGPPPS